MTSKLEEACLEKGLRMTDQRRIIAKTISEAKDHPDVEEIYRRASDEDSKISIATVYRTIRMFEEEGIVSKLDIGDGKSRYEIAPETHHDHLIDIETGKVIEFFNADIERIQNEIAKSLGYKLTGHRLELYGVPIRSKKS